MYKKQRRVFRAAGGDRTAFKISIINTGDSAQREFPASSCTNQHLVLVGDARGVLQGYHSCSWFDGHWKYVGLDPKSGRNIIDIQPRPMGKGEFGDRCYKADSYPSTVKDSSKGCMLVESDEWLTITQQITIGAWANNVGDARRSSNVKVWMAREGEAPLLVFDHDRNLQRPEAPDMKYGKIWLIPYFTNKDIRDFHPTATMWFDELIISRRPIPAAR